MKVDSTHWKSTLSVTLVFLVLLLSGCSKSDNPVEPLPSRQADYEFTEILPYSELTLSEVSASLALSSSHAERLRGLISELSLALSRDYRSDQMDPSYGVDRYRVYLERINATLTPTQREAFGRIVAYHVDVIVFGKHLRFFLYRLARALELTPKQIEEIKGCARTYVEGARSIYGKVKDGTLNREEAKQELRKLFEEFVDCFKNVLTPEQLEKLKEILDRHRSG